MPKRVRNLGPHAKVHTVDVTGLNCNVRVFGVADSTQTVPHIEGPWLAVGKVREEIVSTRAGIELILTNGQGSVRVSRTGNATAGPGGDVNTGVRGRPTGGSIRVSRTGNATAGPGGSANTGVDLTGGRPIGTHVVGQNDPFRRRNPESSVTVTMFVKYGTRVLH
ncbi:MAG TPA: hypothetical protein VJM46_04565 [Candidatus Saccharimonadales bacterium]|nr:hypothetical protein [Candidatus Saccharimonadales bacterium]